MNVAVKKPEIPPSSINVIVTASDLFEDSSSSNAQFWLACADCLHVDVIDFDLGGVEMIPDGGKGLCLRKSSSVDDRDEDDE